VPGVSGTWKDLTDNVNFMAGNLTEQVRGIAKVVTAVANGDLQAEAHRGGQGRDRGLADTINNMIDTLATFADQVTTVAREVGVEGKARRPGQRARRRRHVEGPDRQRQPAGRQPHHAGARHRRSRHRRDQGRPDPVDQVEARGEVAALKDNINEMIGNLRETTQKNTEQDWLKTNLAKFTACCRAARSGGGGPAAPVRAGAAGQRPAGVFYRWTRARRRRLSLLAGYANRERQELRCAAP
jgi:HAMP domain-containing protein